MSPISFGVMLPAETVENPHELRDDIQAFADHGRVRNR